jgi:hypothetical protein
MNFKFWFILLQGFLCLIINLHAPSPDSKHIMTGIIAIIGALAILSTNDKAN